VQEIGKALSLQDAQMAAVDPCCHGIACCQSHFANSHDGSSLSGPGLHLLNAISIFGD
jgi:hypothetical protein